MKAALLSVVNELKRLNQDGISHVHVSEEAMQSLKDTVLERIGNRAAPIIEQTDEERRLEEKKAIESIPARIRSATGEDFDKVLAMNPEEIKKVASKVKEKSPFPLSPPVELPEGSKQEQWDFLKEKVLGCSVCTKQAPEGGQVVFGIGNLDADILFCGEAPGAEETAEGEPFMGESGQLLNKMIKAMGSDRGQVYLSTIMNWRPVDLNSAGSRKPTDYELEFCMPYLKAQIEIVKPKVVVVMGVVASKAFFGKDAFKSLRDIKGEWREFMGIPTIATYHPSYLLRNSSHRDKRNAWEDLLKVMEKSGLPISDKQRGFFL